MPSFDLFSIGHSNIPVERFIALLRAAGVSAVADVRSIPVSRFFPWFSANNLQDRLARESVAYLSYGRSLGGRPRDLSFYRDNVVDYEVMARSNEFQAALDRLLDQARRTRLCIMCAERDPLDCHRFLLVARALAARGAGIGHILHDGAIEPQVGTEQRLLAWDATEGDLFAPGQEERLAAAYARRARAVAYRAKPGSSGATSRSRR